MSISEGSCDSAVSTVVHTPTSVNTLSTDSVDSLADVTSYETTEQVAKALIEFLVTRYFKIYNSVIFAIYTLLLQW